MLSKERQRIIFDLITKNGAVTTSELMQRFDVSIETVRRDFLFMEKQGMLIRVHGGAVKKNDMKHFGNLKQRNEENSFLKYELSIKATEFINEGDVISVDSGSTAISFAQALKEKFSSLTVITHSLDVFEILQGYENFNIILLGGYFLKEENSFFGPLTAAMLQTLHIHKAFIFPSAISLELGIYDYQKDLFPIQKQMISLADDVYILADSSKFEKKALLKVDSMNAYYSFITDSNLSDRIVDLYKENNIKIYKAKVNNNGKTQQ